MFGFVFGCHLKRTAAVSVSSNTQMDFLKQHLPDEEEEEEEGKNTDERTRTGRGTTNKQQQTKQAIKRGNRVRLLRRFKWLLGHGRGVGT